MKIVLFGLRYSPNLGDGVISDCLSHGLNVCHPDVNIETVDISGRDSYGAVTIRGRTRIIALLHHLPQTVRHRLAHWKLGRLLDRVEPQWRRALDGADLAIIGGGMLFSDASLNFPIKTARVADLLRETQTPAVICAVGAARNWSRAGRALFWRVFDADLRLVSLRDETSRRAWNDQTPDSSPDPEIVLDPGLLAAECYGPAQCGDRVGVCITDPRILGHHADGSIAGGDRPADEFYTDIVAALLEKGHRVCLFSNGASEDADLLDTIAASERLKTWQRTGAVSVAPRPTTPAELVATIAQLKAVIAHRLHACIVAYSYGRPVVGLGWDQKLQSFFALVGDLDLFIEKPDVSGEQVASAGISAMRRGIPEEIHQDLTRQALAGIELVLTKV